MTSKRNATINRLVQATTLYGRLNKTDRRALVVLVSQAYDAGRKDKGNTPSSVRCPFCQAEPGKWCSVKGIIVPIHNSRISYAAELAALDN